MIAFRGAQAYRSNMHSCRIVGDYGFVYSNAEALYMSYRTNSVDYRGMFVGLTGPEARKLKYRVPTRPDWDDIKEQIMLQVVRMKFAQNTQLAIWLMESTDEIVEYNEWHDNFFGVCTCSDCANEKSYNKLGHILMKVRNELRQVHHTVQPALKYGIVISGSRSITDAETFYHRMDEVTALLQGKDLTIIFGDAQGVDTIAQQYAIDRNIGHILFKKDWSKGKAAGFIRDAEMRSYADNNFDCKILCYMWDAISNGTPAMVRRCIDANYIVYPLAEQV